MSDRPVRETGNKAQANATADENAWLRLALRAIEGPADSGPFIEAYRDAGGGYEGLQAVATFALESVGREPASARPAPDGQGSDQSPGPEPSTESWRSRLVGEREERLREAAIQLIEAADQIDTLDHRLNDGRMHGGRIILGGTEIQDHCLRIREIARALASSPSPPDREQAIEKVRRVLAEGSYLTVSEALPYRDQAVRIVAALFGRGDEK